MSSSILDSTDSLSEMNTLEQMLSREKMNEAIIVKSRKSHLVWCWHGNCVSVVTYAVWTSPLQFGLTRPQVEGLKNLIAFDRAKLVPLRALLS